MKFDQSNECFGKALSIRKQLKDYAKISEAYENLGYMELKRGNYKTSLLYYNKSLPPAESANYQLGKAWSLYGLGRVNVKLGQFQKALDYFDLAEKKAIEINAKEALTDIYREKTDLFKAQRKFEQSLHYSQLGFALYDSLHRSAVGQRFGSLQRFQEIKQKEREIESLGKEKELARGETFAARAKVTSAVLFYFIGCCAGLCTWDFGVCLCPVLFQRETTKSCNQ
jgi:tetratricopeptide (TPR) repeat protein